MIIIHFYHEILSDGNLPYDYTFRHYTYAFIKINSNPFFRCLSLNLIESPVTSRAVFPKSPEINGFSTSKKSFYRFYFKSLNFRLFPLKHQALEIDLFVGFLGKWHAKVMEFHGKSMSSLTK
jgi:hypothetical protein